MPNETFDSGLLIAGKSFVWSNRDSLCMVISYLPGEYLNEHGCDDSCPRHDAWCMQDSSTRSLGRKA